jgi:hypothetical protein
MPTDELWIKTREFGKCNLHFNCLFIIVVILLYFGNFINTVKTILVSIRLRRHPWMHLRHLLFLQWFSFCSKSLVHSLISIFDRCNTIVFSGLSASQCGRLYPLWCCIYMTCLIANRLLLITHIGSKSLRPVYFSRVEFPLFLSTDSKCFRRCFPCGKWPYITIFDIVWCIWVELSTSDYRRIYMFVL